MEKLTKIRYHQPDLDTRVISRSKEIELGIISNAENYAMRNQPSADNESIKPFFEENHLQFQGLIEEVNQSLQVKTSIHHVIDHKDVTEKKERDILNKLSAVKEKQNRNAGQLDGKKPPFSKTTMLFVLITTVGLFLGDVIFNVPVFESYGYILAEAFFLGLVFALLLSILAHFYERIVGWGKVLWQKRAIGISLLLLLLVLFYTMAAHRAHVLELKASEDTSAAISISPLPFVILSILMFLGVVVINHFFFPTKDQRQAMQEFQRLVDEKQEIDEAYKQLKDEECAIDNEHVEVRHMNASILEYGCSLEDSIMSKAHEGFTLWKKHNAMHRKDNCRPPSFDQTGYPFTFRTNFQSFKNNPQS